MCEYRGFVVSTYMLIHIRFPFIDVLPRVALETKSILVAVGGRDIISRLLLPIINDTISLILPIINDHC